MRDIIKLYAENSSVEFLQRMDKCDVLRYEIYKIGDWAIYHHDMRTISGPELRENEYKLWRQCDCSDFKYHITDYSCVIEIKCAGATAIRDFSDEWVAHLVEFLPDEYREKYLQGLPQFSDNVANALKQDVLKAVNIEQTKIKRNIIDLDTPEERLIKKQIEVQKAEEEKRKREELERLEEIELEKRRKDAYEKLCELAIESFKKNQIK